jgi:hypothetical protein
MSLVVSETAALAIAAAIEKQTAVMVTQNGILNAFLLANFSPAGAITPNTPIAIARVQAQSMNDIHIVMTNMIKQQQAIVSSIEVIQSGMASVSSQIAAGVTTSQLATADQIKANKFQQQTTNASLKRADLPETEVTDESFLASTKTLVSDTLTFKSQISISSLIEGQISSAVSWIGTTTTNMVSNSFIGAGARSALGTVKGWFAVKEPEVEAVKSVSATAAATRAGLLADPKPPIPPGTWI